jgi:hypothetical protein
VAVALWSRSGCDGPSKACSREAASLGNARLEALSDRLAPRVMRRVERIRGLRFHDPPGVEVLGQAGLAALGRRLRRGAQATVGSRQSSRVLHAKVGFLELAGLYPSDLAFERTPKTVAEPIDGAYDYSTNRVILVRGRLESRREVELTLAHELTHALEDQNFALHLRSVAARQSEAADAREALIEGTATYVEARYLRHQLGDRVSIPSRLSSSGIVISAEDEPPAIRARHVVEYVQGALFVRQLRLRGGWPLVNRALRHPPRTTSQVFHPASWPRGGPGERVGVGAEQVLEPGWRQVGGGVAGEDDVRFMLVLGTAQHAAIAAAHGWRGGRFELWRMGAASADCQVACPERDVAVMGLRWRSDLDPVEFYDAASTYLALGRVARRDDSGLWGLTNGFAAIASAQRASGLAFAPSGELAQALAQRAARRASAPPP